MTRPSAVRTARAAVAVLLTASAGLVLTPTGPATAADPSRCDLEAAYGPTYHWVAGALPNEWNEAVNWEVDGATPANAPGYAERNALVCIPGDAQVTLVHNDDTSRGEAIIRAFDLAAGAVLTIHSTGRLYTSGTGAERSVVRRAGATPAVLVLQGALGGIGEVRVDGLLSFEHAAGFGAAAMTTRHCQTFVTLACHPDAPPKDKPVTEPGRTVISPDGVLRVSGANGVNLDDARVIDVRGLMEVLGPGYVAADNGTAITIRDGGTLALVDDAHIYQGNRSFRRPRALVTLAGTVTRGGIAATSLIDARVAVTDTAEADVSTGFLSLGNGVAPLAEVDYGASYGVGRCGSVNATCDGPVATRTDPLTASITMPAGPPGAAVVEVLAEQQPAEVSPVRIHVTDVVATPQAPMEFRFVVDKTRVGTRGAGSFDVLRRKDGTARYRVVPDCSAGLPPVGWKACVASRSKSNGDVTLVVRTQVSSRWKIR